MDSANPYSAAVQAPPASAIQSSRRRLRITNVDVMAIAKLLGILYAVLGLVVGLFMALAALVGTIAGGGDAMVGGVLTGVGAVVFLPIFYGIAGFIGGAFSALLYNFVAGMVGGMILEVEG